MSKPHRDVCRRAAKAKRVILGWWPFGYSPPRKPDHETAKRKDDAHHERRRQVHHKRYHEPSPD